MAETTYEVELLNSNIAKFFTGVYNDFRAKAVSEYKFELEPLSYEEFVDAVEKNYMQCIVLKENDIPTAFLVYTTSISEGVELNIIHCLGTEDEVAKVKLLIEKFLEFTINERQSKVVSYPMIGHQSVFTADIAKYGFKYVGLAVLRFFMGNASSERILENMKLSEKTDDYKIVGYDPSYKDTPVGFAFANVTGGKIANIPLVGIDKAHRGKGFSGHLLNRSIKTIVDWTKLGKRVFSEVNVTTETNNYKALKMYRRIGFREDFCYPQAYLVPKKK